MFVGLAIIGNMVFAGSMNGLETVNEARAVESDALLEVQTGNLALDRAELVVDTLHLYVDNTGGDTFSVTGTTVLVNGVYLSPVTSRVRGDRNTDIWAPGETLYMVFHDDSLEGASSVQLRITTERGITITEEVSV